MNRDKPSVDGLFLAALELPPEQRQAWLDDVCRDDFELRQRLERLLNASSDVGNFLESPAEELANTRSDPPAASFPRRIGPYKLLQEIGEGGMGVVYLAEQKVPVRRRVALKVIKPGMDSRKVIARFEAERQALAMMDHPNIARVLDAGTTDSGRPYFVMELVKGVRITDYCDEKRLTAGQRLELFVHICQAVQHAHQKGVIHRDIKPSNVLVAEYDDHPVPKIIDFGVAKAVQQPLTERTMFTEFGQVVGTIDYMSPEQAKLNQNDVDTRTDVYALGVLMYELLTGDTPLDRQRLHSAAFDEMLKIIREEEPLRPSVRLSSNAQLPAIAANRHVEPRKLSALVRGELDWIVMKALEKNRSRRYDSASKFAEDIRHYLANETVSACPPSAAYRLGKFARRNRSLLATAAFITAALILGFAGTTWQALRATDQRDRARRAESWAAAEAEKARAESRRATVAEERAVANAERAETEASRAIEQAQRAETEAAISQAVNDFLRFDLLGMASAASQVSADLVPEHDIKLRTVLDRAADNIPNRFGDSPLVEAAIRRTIGDAYHSLGEYRKAESNHRRVRDLNIQVHGSEHLDTLISMERLASAIAEQGRHDESEKLLQQALGIRLNKFGLNNLETLASMRNLASEFWRRGRTFTAENILREVLAIQYQLVGEQHGETLKTLHSLANSLSSESKHEESEQLRRYVLRISRQALGPQHPRTLGAMNNLAISLSAAGQHAKAEELYIELVSIQRRVLGPAHPETLRSTGNLANAILDQDRLDEAINLHQKSFDLARNTRGFQDTVTQRQRSWLATALRTSCWRLATQRDQNEVDTEKVLQLADKLVKLDSRNANHHALLGVAFFRNGQWQAAIDALENARGMKNGADPAHQFFLAMAHWQAGNKQDALSNYVDAIHWLAQQPEKKKQQCRFRDETLDIIGVDEIIRYSKAGLVEQPNQPLMLLVRAGALARSSQFDRAAEDYCQAADLWAPLNYENTAAIEDELYPRTIALCPDDLGLVQARMNYLAERGRWIEIRKQLEDVKRIVPKDYAGWNGAALLAAYLDDIQDYRENCDTLLNRFVNTEDHGLCESLARTCLLVPGLSRQTERASSLANRALSEGRGYWNDEWIFLTKALADYRAGQFQSAIDHARRCHEHAGRRIYLDAMSFVLIGMSQHQLHQTAAASQSLCRACLWERKMPTVEDGDLRKVDADWLYFQVLLREAEELMEVSRADALELASQTFRDHPVDTDRGHVSSWSLANLLKDLEFWDGAAAIWAQQLDQTGRSRSYPSPLQGVCSELAKSPELFERVVRLRPNERTLWIGRGEYHALRSRWRKAAEDYLRARPYDSPVDETFQFAGLLVLTGNQEEYQRLCTTLSQRYEVPVDGFTAFILARVGSIGAESPIRPELLVQWARRAVDEKETAWRLHTLGLAQYRAGEFKQALAALQKSSARGDWSEQAKAQNNLVVAMVHHREGRQTEAKDWFHRAALVINLATPEEPDLPPADIAVPDWIGLNTLRREAESLILHDQVESLETAHPLQRAIQRANRILEQQPDEQAALLMRAEAWAAAGPNPAWPERNHPTMTADQMLDAAASDYARILEGSGPTDNPWWRPMVLTGKAAIRNDQIFNRLAALRPADRVLRIARIHFLASNHRWDETAQLMDLVVGLDSFDDWGWYHSAALALFRDDQEAYRRCCQEMVQRFANSPDPGVRERVAMTCLLARDDREYRELSIPLASDALMRVRGGNSEYVAWFHMAKALADYRAAQWSSAIRHARNTFEGGRYRHREATALFIQAMAEYQMQQRVAGSHSLFAAQAIVENEMPRPASEVIDRHWSNWLRCQIIQREAEELFDTGQE